MRCTTESEEEKPVEQMGKEVPEEIDAKTGGPKQARTSFSKIDRQAREVVFLKPEGRIVFAVSTYTGSLYRSSDYGATWTNQNSHLPGFLAVEKQEGEEDAAAAEGDRGVFSIHVHPNDPKEVFFVGNGKTNWYSMDGGKTYEVREMKWSMRKGGMKWHPTEAQTGLGYREDPDCLAERTVRCYGQLMLTRDGGATWDSAAQNIKWPNYAWAKTAW